ncbi:MAG TPA: DNA/RNA nuclease SfsA [Tissierellaceae bacterium]|nr:DNA/RNA nuclease SfsA [Tissierellaceae bacterium]
MKYIYDGEFLKGIFINRPNRFIAEVKLDGEIVKAHVKNTGRLKDLLVPGRKCYLMKAKNPNRKTKYDLISIEREDRYVNLDTQVPNIIVKEAFLNSKVEGWENPDNVESEITIGNSRLDLLVEKEGKKLYIEIKSVDFLIDNYISSFPGAPTERGRKHLRELKKIVENGDSAMVFFLVVREEAKAFRPCYEIDKEFSDIFYDVLDNGVEARAYLTEIGYNSLTLKNQIPILSKDKMMETIDKNIIEW